MEKDSVHSILEYTASDGKVYKTQFYNLDAILSVGYRVNSVNATAFRRWATTILKQYLLRGYSINQQLIQMEDRIDRRLESQHDEIQRIVLIDNYVDDSVLTLLDKRSPAVTAEIYTSQISTKQWQTAYTRLFAGTGQQSHRP